MQSALWGNQTVSKPLPRATRRNRLDPPPTPHFNLTCLYMGTADAETRVCSAENPEVTNVRSFKPGVGQNIAAHASPTARNSFFVPYSTFPVYSHLEFFKIVSLIFSCVGTRNVLSHPVQGHSEFKQVTYSWLGAGWPILFRKPTRETASGRGFGKKWRWRYREGRN